MNKIRQFVQLNGWYLLGDELWTRARGLVRGRLLGRQLRTQGLHIGRYARLRGLRYMQIGRDFQAGDSLWIEAVARYESQVFAPRIVIGDSVRVSQWVHIAATNSVEIGDHCLIGSKVIITDHAHGQYAKRHSSPLEPPAVRQLDHDRKVVIGRNVWLGDGVVVMPDVTIGEGCVIGANSVVSRDIPPFSMAVGAPATPIKRYDFSTHEWEKI